MIRNLRDQAQGWPVSDGTQHFGCKETTEFETLDCSCGIADVDLKVAKLKEVRSLVIRMKPERWASEVTQSGYLYTEGRRRRKCPRKRCRNDQDFFNMEREGTGYCPADRLQFGLGQYYRLKKL